MHSPRGQGIESPLGAPRQETAQIRVRVITEGARESGQISSHRQAKRIGSSHEVSRSGKAGIGKSLHDQTHCARTPAPYTPTTGLTLMTGCDGVVRTCHWPDRPAPASQAVVSSSNPRG